MSPKPTILIVDDEPDLREVLEAYSSHLKATSRSVPNGALSTTACTAKRLHIATHLLTSWRCST